MKEIQAREQVFKQRVVQAEQTVKEIQAREQEFEQRAKQAEQRQKKEVSELADRVKELNAAAGEVAKLAEEKRKAAEQHGAGESSEAPEKTNWKVARYALFIFGVVIGIASLPHLFGWSSNVGREAAEAGLRIIASAILEKTSAPEKKNGESQESPTEKTAYEGQTSKDVVKSRTWMIKGLILSDNEFAEYAKVFALARDDLGNEFVSNAEADETGNFELLIPQRYTEEARPRIEQIVVSRRK